MRGAERRDRAAEGARFQIGRREGIFIHVERDLPLRVAAVVLERVLGGRLVRGLERTERPWASGL